MKSTFIIDWDDKSITDIDLEKIVINSPIEFNLIVLSSCSPINEVIKQLKNKYLDHEKKVNSIVILNPEQLLNRNARKKLLAENKLEILNNLNYLNEPEKLKSYYFISANVPARSEFKKIGIESSYKLPEINVKKIKNYLHPTKQTSQNFTISNLKTFSPSTGNRFGAKMGTLFKNETKKYSNMWFIKEKSTEMCFIQLEVFAGELLRFLLGESQPKSRYLIDDKKILVLSKAVPEFINFNSEEVINKLIKNKFKGLLPVLFSCMFIEEADLKTDNIGMDVLGNIVKIDNDGAFTSIIFSMEANSHEVPSFSNLSKLLTSKFSFSLDDIDAPHHPKNYSALCWVDLFFKQFKDEDILSNENLEDLYYIFIKIISTSSIIFHLMEKNIERDDMKLTLKELLNHKIESLIGILKNHSNFNDFLLKNYDKIMDQIKNDIKKFKNNNSKYFENDKTTILDIRDIFLIQKLTNN